MDTPRCLAHARQRSALWKALLRVDTHAHLRYEHERLLAVWSCPREQKESRDVRAPLFHSAVFAVDAARPRRAQSGTRRRPVRVLIPRRAPGGKGHGLAAALPHAPPD